MTNLRWRGAIRIFRHARRNRPNGASPTRRFGVALGSAIALGLKVFAAFTIAAAFSIHEVRAQSFSNLNALEGLAPVSTLLNTAAGKAALRHNFFVTAVIQNGNSWASGLLPFPDQEQQALRDAAITSENGYELADGLGTSLGGAYQSLTHYTSPDDGKTSDFNNISPAIARLFAYAGATELSDSSTGKYFFANATIDGKTPVSANAQAVIARINGITDVFGKAYDAPSGSQAGDRYGDPRPFQTELRLTPIFGKDFFGVESSNIAYLLGPTQDLTNSPAFPSGHTTYGYTEALLFAILVPQRYPQMVARAAEYGNSRIVLGAHYAMDVLAGRTLAMYDLAQLLANRTGYVGLNLNGTEIDDFRKAVADARADLTAALEARCGNAIGACATRDDSRFHDPAKNQLFYETTQTYDLPAIFAETVAPEDVAKVAPEAGYLLTAAFPYLSLAQADAILTATEGPGGGFLDNGSAFGVYSRLDLYRASQMAIELAPKGQ